eukprot:3132796-Rhodomonas_salina.1
MHCAGSDCFDGTHHGGKHDNGHQPYDDYGSFKATAPPHSQSLHRNVSLPPTSLSLHSLLACSLLSLALCVRRALSPVLRRGLRAPAARAPP